LDVVLACRIRFRGAENQLQGLIFAWPHLLRHAAAEFRLGPGVLITLGFRPRPNPRPSCRSAGRAADGHARAGIVRRRTRGRYCPRDTHGMRNSDSGVGNADGLKVGSPKLALPGQA
jgi:hypothetical protein